MAGKALKKLEKELEEQLNCPICLDTYTDPKLLQCFHVYCRQCLVPLVIRDQQGQLGLTCPICRLVTPIPDRGVVGLQSAFHVNHLLEIQDSVKKLENSAAALEGAVVNSPDVRHCFEHPMEELKLYCETCGKPVCYKCVLSSGKHQNHYYQEFVQAFRQYREEIASFLEPMEKQVTTIKKALAQLDTCCREISDQRAATAGNIHITFRQLREVLVVRETELISQLDQIVHQKLKSLAAQRDQIEITLAQLNSCLHFMRGSLRPGNDVDVLMMKTNTVGQAEELITPFQPDILEPNTEADIIFTASADMTAVCQKSGRLLLAKELPDSSNCHITEMFVEVAVVGEKSMAILQAVNFEGKPCVEPIKSLECEITSEITGSRAICSVERRGQSQYKISYQPTIKGRHQLQIKAEGQCIRGSPFSVAVTSSVENLGTPILNIGGVEGPWGVAINQRGEVVVTEYNGHCVSVFSPSGEKLRSFGTHGSGDGQLEHPLGIAIDDEGHVLVADVMNDRIQMFTAEGQYFKTVGAKGNGPLQFIHPVDITFNAKNDKIYIVDDDNNRVQILNYDHTFSSTFGKEGSNKGEFKRPRCAACDSTGKVYVADSGNHRIQVFTAEGKFVRTFGRWGPGRGELNWPIGVAIDANDRIYVGESGNCRVSVFTSEGDIITSFGKEGCMPGEFYGLRGLAVDSCGVVYVCDSRFHNHFLIVTRMCAIITLFTIMTLSY